jgi:hypothetical protein
MTWHPENVIARSAADSRAWFALIDALPPE